MKDNTGVVVRVKFQEQELAELGSALTAADEGTATRIIAPPAGGRHNRIARRMRRLRSHLLLARMRSK